MGTRQLAQSLTRAPSETRFFQGGNYETSYLCNVYCSRVHRVSPVAAHKAESPRSTRPALERARARARCLNKLRRLEQLSEQRFRAREPWVHAECRWWIHNVRCAGRALRLALPSAIALAAEKAAVPLVLVSRFTRCRSARSSEACW